MYIKSIYDIDICDCDGKIIRMSHFRGKFVMIVNIASDPAFNDQLEEIELCYRLFKNHKFVVLGFPTDQFNEEPLDDDELSIQLEKTSPVSFPLFKKILVNGHHAHPLFQFITHSLPGIFGTESIKWNFTKFIIGPDGSPLKRFSPITNIHVINEYIAELVEPNRT
ncbi:MAG: glutathione peroxidase [Pseudomonadota bacterium]|nr:glutathione peroxidase [Pseudomonadota bacterium]